MPARRRAGKSSRARRAAGALKALALDMEVPLNEATDAAHALRFIGYGLMQHPDDREGRAVAAIARTACERLDTLRDIWDRLCKLAARGR